MNKLLKLNAIAAAVALTTTVADAQVFIKFENIPASSNTGGYGDDGTWFIADSFSFAVEREMKESGEKGGTEDINIGVGELQECTISKSMDAASAQLAKLSLTGSSLGAVQVCLTDNPEGPTGCYLEYKLERAFVKSWSTSGAGGDDRPTEEVAFYYNRIAFEYTETADGTVSWDRKKKRPWDEGERSLTDSR
ncbi:MAG: type VI secretion system tube protein Hcp [Gammaproteobacteria bacterium]